MVRRASHAKTHCHSLQNAILHQSKKEQNALAHWTCCMFFVYLFLAKLVQSYKYNMHWHSLVFYQPQLYILPCLTKATKAKCTGTKTKSMQFFCVHVLSCKAHASTDWAKRIGTVILGGRPFQDIPNFWSDVFSCPCHWGIHSNRITFA